MGEKLTEWKGERLTEWMYAPLLPRALKTKHETPKYGLIYHASLIGQSSPKFKGKISRVLAAKCALAIRVDALGDSQDASIGIDSRAKVGGAWERKLHGTGEGLTHWGGNQGSRVGALSPL